MNKNLTKINFNTGTASRIKYIVMHYVGGVSTAFNNTQYFKDEYRGASAHYFVDELDVWQCVEDKDIAWHCGANTYKHPYCRNANSIGIELCCKKTAEGTWYFEKATISRAIKLVQSLMKKYNIPVQNVIRHYDVTGKVCPEPWVRYEQDWEWFKRQLVSSETRTGKVVGVSSYLNVRAGNTTSSSVIGKLENGDLVVIGGRAGMWYEINYDGRAGFVYASYIQEDLKEGDSVAVLSEATCYANSSKEIPNWVKSATNLKIDKVDGGRARVQPINSWVWVKDLCLIG